LETKQVVSSHLIPAGLYAYTSGPDGDHVSFNGRVARALVCSHFAGCPTLSILKGRDFEFPVLGA
jgi:hypothetical protein